MQKFLKFNRYIGDSLKICMISFSNIHSGNATRILNLAKNLSKNIDVEIIFDGSRNNYIPEKFKDLKIKFTPYLGNRYLTFLYGIFYKTMKLMKKYDIVHCFQPLPSSFIPAFIISKVRRAKLIVSWDDWEGKNGLADFEPIFLRDFLDFFQIWSIRKADMVICISPFLTKMAKKINKNARFIPNGADTESFRPGVKGRKIRKMFNCPLVVYVGLLYKTCDLDIVINAMKYVVENVPAKLIVVGDGPRKNEFVRLAKKLGLEKDVAFIGYKPRELVPEYVGAADVVVLPMKDNLINRSRSPVKLGEYMASGKAVVASNVGIARDIIKNYHNGILTSNKPEEFGKAICRLLKDKKLRRRIEKNARKTVEERFSWKRIAKEFLHLYNEVIVVKK
jgi:glycosyltransferase involved in cell wall biosynthesis